MIKTVNSDEQRNEILATLEKHSILLKKMPITSKKRGIIRNIIIEILEHFPQIKLPSIRAMATALGVSIVSVQKTISELTEEGLLRTKKRSFVISEIKSKESSSTTEPTSFCPFGIKFEFRTGSIDDYQKNMWFKMQNRFNSEHPHINVELDFASYPDNVCKKFDAIECFGYGWQAQTGKLNLLPIRRFIPTEKKKSQQPDYYSDMHIPLYYQTNYLFYNPKLLKEHNIPLPKYSNFEEQLEYMIDSEKKCKKAKLETKPFSTIQPVTLLGNLLPVFLNCMRNKTFESKEKKYLSSGFGKILRYMNLCNFNYNGVQPGSDYNCGDFFTERSPFFIGISSSYWKFKNRNIDIDWQVYPLFSADDKFVKLPIVGMVSAGTNAPIESIKFISFITRDDIQKDFFTPTGMIPRNLNIEDTEILFNKNIAKQFNTDFKTSTPLFLKEEKDYYLVNSILNGEFWTNHINKKENGKELLEQVIFLSKAINTG